MWQVLICKSAAKELKKIPKSVVEIYQVLVDDLKTQGPSPMGWYVKTLKGREELSIRLNRKYRVLVLVVEPDLIVVKIAHRKEAYE